MDNYVVMENDTLTSIANKYDVSIKDLKDINNLVGDDISLGDVLVIPKDTNIYDYYKVKKDDTLYKIARMHNTESEILRKINGLSLNDYLYPDETLFVPKKGLRFYITKEGDSINDVGIYFNTSSCSVAENNTNIYLVKDQLLIHKK